MSKLELHIKVNDRILTEEEQKFINQWLKILEFCLENNCCELYSGLLKKSSLELQLELILKGVKNASD